MTAKSRQAGSETHEETKGNGEERCDTASYKSGDGSQRDSEAFPHSGDEEQHQHQKHYEVEYVELGNVEFDDGRGKWQGQTPVLLVDNRRSGIVKYSTSGQKRE